MEDVNRNSNLYHKIYEGERITPEEALELFSWDIIELGTAGDIRRKLANEGTKTVVDKFSINLNVEKTIEIYDKLLSKGN